MFLSHVGFTLLKREDLFMSFSACIFDMDGVLLDSEPFWRRAEREIFSRVGIHLTEEDCVETMGIRIDEVVRYRFNQHPGHYPPIEDVAQRIVNRVAELVESEGRPLPGVITALDFLQEQQLPLALASSSSAQLITTTLKALKLEKFFPLWHSAEGEPYGKPHPAVYLATCAKLGVQPHLCLAIEDSLNGVIAAKAARMSCVAVPEKAVAQLPQFAIADVTLNSLAELPKVWAALNA